jgi:hypothetical protein
MSIIEQLEYVIAENDPDACKAVFTLDECKKISAVIRASRGVAKFLSPVSKHMIVLHTALKNISANGKAW